MDKQNERILQGYKDLGISEQQFTPNTGKYDFAKQWKEISLTRSVPTTLDSKATPTDKNRS